MVIQILPVRNRKERRHFLTFPWKVYGDDPLWVPPLIPERMRTIDPERGVFFQRGTAELFAAWQNGKMVGTICIAEDKITNQARSVNECMIGFLEYIPDYAVFCALIEKAVVWARNRDLESLAGPFNLDYEDGYGVLVRGRQRPPALLCGHTPAYYQEFMERYGFKPARAANLAFAINLDETPETRRLSRIADKLRQRERITVRGARFDEWENEIDRVYNLLEKAFIWSDNPIPWQREALENMVAPFRHIADPELILFADVGGETVGWFPGIPNLNEVFIKVGGLRYPWNYAQLWWYMRRPVTSLTVKSVLVLPEYHKRGVAVLLFDEMARRARARGCQWVDLSITSEDNPDTVGLSERMGAFEYKRWQVYQLSI
ncbi:GNAT family N-acetyltransferase [Chloroflexota bacterium]